ncbi:mast cell protease 1A-like [Hipposideros larvatus]
MQPLLLLMVFLLSPRAEAGEIIGGHEANHFHGYMAYLRINSSKSEYCGGFLLCEDILLTAARCWGSSITVILGAHNIKQKETTQQEIRMKRAIRHPNYNNPPYANDIMLLQLENMAKLNNAVWAIKMPTRRNEVYPGMVCSVAGWGYLGVNTSGDGKLHYVKLEIQSKEECTSRYKHYNNTIQICGGDPKKIQTTFKGDSGGPLICNNMAQGIVSYGKNNGKPPGVYTRISKFLPWMEKTMKRLKLLRSD